MKTWKRSLLATTGLFLALAAVVGLGILLGTQATAAPAYLPLAAPIVAQGGTPVTALPATTCIETAPGVRTCHLWAMTGTVTLPTGAVVPIWGFAETQTGPATLPGPAIIANQGETLEVVLHNNLLTETVSLDFPGQPDLAPDFDGIDAGFSTTYTLVVGQPGTFAYEAGLTPHGPRQVAMGLFGALVVRPLAPGQAYDDPATAYDDEVLVVMSEIDPALNTDPYGFSLTQFAPKYWLINGLAYPQTVEIPTIAGNRVLLRYLNAGLEVQSMGLLGLRQWLVGSDGRPLPHPYYVVAETVASGQTIDALVTIPAATVQGTRYAFYNTSLLLHNAGAPFPAPGPVTFGGAMTFLQTVTGTPPYDGGPVASLVQVTPTRIGTVGDVTLSAHLSAGAGLNVTAAEWFTNSLGAPGTGQAFTVAPGPAVDVSAVIPQAMLAGWPSGYPAFYVRGQDDSLASVWGAVGSAVLNLDKTGPSSTGLELVRNPTNGTRPVRLYATGDDHANGWGNVTAGLYGIDAAPSISMTLNRTDNTVVAMTATIPSASLVGLAEGPHQVLVSARDDLNNWGASTVITLSLDKTGPTVESLIASPNPLDLSGPPPVTHIRLEGLITDTLSAGLQSPLANAEAFVDPVGIPPNGTGIVMFASDGLFDEIGEAVYFDIPLANFLWLAQGPHTIAARGLDVAGNWGALGTTILTIERGATDTEGPIITGLTVTPNPTNGTALVTLTAGAMDPDLLSNIDTAVWWIRFGPRLPLQAVDGALDSPVEALTAQIDVSAWENGAYTLIVNARDAEMNWGAQPATVVLNVTGNPLGAILADNFNGGTLDAWTAAVGAVALTPAAGIGPDGGLGLQATLDGGAESVAPAYLSYVMPPGETRYQASFWFDPNSAEVGTQHHDIFSGLYGETPIFGLQVESSGEPGGYEVRGWALADGTPAYTEWYDLTDAPQALSIRWQSGAAARLTLIVDGIVVEELTGLNTSMYQVYEIRLGPSANLDPASAGSEYYDTFSAIRMIRVFLPYVSRN